MKSAWVFLLSFAFLLHSEASEKVQIKSMQEVVQKVEELKKQYTAQEILVVFDIDNTLLTTETDLGGDAWFSWQEEKLKNNDTQDLVAKDFDGLLRVQSYLYALSQMRAPETMSPNMVRLFQQQGHPVFLLTSRGPEYQNFTQRELARAGYDPSLTSPGPVGGYVSRFLPIQTDKPAESCLTAEELTTWGIKDSKPSVYEDGVFYTAGQHKGAMLRSILCKTKKYYPVIVFVDDTEKHVDRVLKSYEAYNVNVISMRYGAMDSQVQNFKNSDKREVIENWAKMKSVLEDVFGRAF
ncbi:DUF2608 domain-containing protein [Bdellovibrio sp. BCCA]|uniref:DUF2608 domain-containing protein n=1 Tax=Bdellovibrio sp. BCCA TaxID=3136281 RepID=UPI0030F089A6